MEPRIIIERGCRCVGRCVVTGIVVESSGMSGWFNFDVGVGGEGVVEDPDVSCNDVEPDLLSE